MAMDLEINCINKSNRQNHWERITHVGGTNADGTRTRWKLTEQGAIAGMDANKYSFHVGAGIHRVEVEIATSARGHRYLRTKADGEQPNNLLSLPECP
jgi:hypothetical protein